MSARVFVLWILIGGGALLVACEGETPVPTVSDQLPFLDADGITIGGQLTFTNPDGIRSAHLRFDTAYHWDDSVHTVLRGVDLTVFTDIGAERAHLTSTAGSMDTRSQRLTARGNVVLLIPAEGRRLESEELHFDPELERIWSDSAVLMTQPGRSPVRGTSFTSDLEFTTFRIVGEGG